MKTLSLVLILFILLGLAVLQQRVRDEKFIGGSGGKEYWFELHRKSNKEFLYFGEPGKGEESAIVKVFNVKTGIPGQRPTPLPDLVGREYWLITDKFEALDNPETAPYFLTLDIPVSIEAPFGPVPYLECEGQCNWELPGAFGLHGNNGDPSKLAVDNPGSSGCVRHNSEDITYLYNLIDPYRTQVRYYVYDI